MSSVISRRGMLKAGAVLAVAGAGAASLGTGAAAADPTAELDRGDPLG